MAGKYEGLSQNELVKLLESRDRKRKLGLVWERDEIEADSRQNADFVAMEIVPELSDKAEPWGNLVIEADNYDALRWLRMTHQGRIKCIYIDPPYNTGTKDWVYNDHYANPEDAYFHSTWLEFMYRRLTIARDLLADDGVILVSINDDQRAKLELLMDEAMPGMRVGSLVWRNRTGGNDGKGAFLTDNHEHVLVFAKSEFRFGGTDRDDDAYTNPDDDPRGPWARDNMTKSHDMFQRPNTFYPIHDPVEDVWYPCNPDQVWRYATKANLKKGQRLRTAPVEDLIQDNRVVFPGKQRIETWNTMEDLLSAIDNDDVPMRSRSALLRRDLPDLEFWIGKRVGFGAPRYKRFKSELKNETKPLSTWITPNSETESISEEDNSIVTGTYDEAAKSIKAVFGVKAFNYAKPVNLIRELVRQATSPGAIVLDFFAGSATTAQAVMELNAEDNGDRRFIMVSSTEATAGLPDKNICRDVTSERIRRLNRSEDKKFADLSAEFAYLRARTIGFEDLDYDLEPSHVWTALQAMHDLPLIPFETDKGWNAYIIDDLVLAFVTRFDADLIPWIESQGPANLIVYSDAPGLLVHELGERNVEVLSARDTLVRRFRK